MLTWNRNYLIGTGLALSALLISSCAILLPSPKTDDTEYVMKHGKLVAISKSKPQVNSSTSALSSVVASSSSAVVRAQATPSVQIPNSYKDIKYPQFSYLPPDPLASRVQVSDSITGYLVSDRRLPTVQLSIYFRESTLPSTPAGVAANALLDPMYRRGGSVHITPAALDDSLELLAAGVGGGLGAFQSELSLNCLSRDFPTVLNILADVYAHPAFDSTRLELQKTVYQQNLLHKFDRPQDVLSALSRKVMFQSGARLWNARPDEVKTVRRAELLKLAAERYSPNRVVFAVSGDFDRDSMLVVMKKFFADWKTPAAKPVAAQSLAFRNQPGVYMVDKAITQANITMAQPFVKRPNPDYYATQLASYILGGGGFTSRLTARIRSDEGLAYSVNSFAGSSYDEVSTTGISLQTKVASAGFAVQIAFEEIRKLTEQGPTEEEMESAKLSLISSLPGLFDSPEATADNFAQSEIMGRAFDHYRKYPAEIRAITAEDVKRCMRTYFTPEKMTVSLVGPASELQKQFPTAKILPLDSLEMR